MEPPTCSCSKMHYIRLFPRADPNNFFRPTSPHLENYTCIQFKPKCIVYKSYKKKKEITVEILSLHIYLAVQCI